MNTTHGESDAATATATIEAIRVFILEMSDPKQPAFLRCFVFSLAQAGESGNIPRKTRVLGNELGDLDRLGDRRLQLAESLASQFYQAAKTYTEMSLRPQLFEIIASNSPDPVSPAVDCHPFRMVPPPGSDGGFGVEGPMGMGDKSLMLRLVEIALKESRADRTESRADRAESRMALNASANRMEALFNETLKKNEMLETSRAELYNQLQVSLNQQNERQIAAHAFMVKSNREEMMWGMAIKEMPRLIDNLTGASVSEIFRALKPEHLQAIFAMCDSDPDLKKLKPKIKQALDMHLGLNLAQGKPNGVNGSTPPQTVDVEVTEVKS